MSTTTDLLADIDRMDAKAFASYLAEDCVLHYANADEVVGRGAIEESIAGFFSTIKGISHDVVGEWGSTTQRSFNSRPRTHGWTTAKSPFPPSRSIAAAMI